jgi:hypothetical protein
VLIQNNENSVILTPFGSLIRFSSLIRLTPAESSGAKSWKAKLRAVAFLFLPLGRNLSAR